MTIRPRFKILFVASGLLLAAWGAAQQEWARYRVLVRNPAEAQRVSDCSLRLFSEEVTLGSTDLVVGPGEGFKLLALRLPYIRIETLPPADAWRNVIGGDADEYRDQYLNMDQILAFYEQLRAQYPNIVTRQAIATSHNGETIYAYRIFNQVAQEQPTALMNVVLIGGIHAREWISPAVAMHLAKKLTEELATSETTLGVKLTDRVGVWVIPSINPDGYRYTWTNDRYWRKNRRNNGGGVYGVDLNRNFAKGWGGAGSSGNPSSDTYRGPAAFSEPEIAGLRNLSNSLPGMKGMIDWHSYAQKILWPWSYTTSAPPDAAALSSLAEAMRNSMLAHGGATYAQGQGSIALYVASGTSKDWYYDVFRCMSYTIELRDTGQYGFTLPPAQIRPTQDEAWWALVTLLETVIPNP